ncbi:hypothetical protein FACS189419_05170 [Planctomycetales bacterium]|nr:hypothetical protein FACS189419_05170 [Planctomycetales bacterium]
MKNRKRREHNPFNDGAVGTTFGLKFPRQTYPCITCCNKEQAIYAYSDKAAVLITVDGDVLESGDPKEITHTKQLWRTMDYPDFGEPLYKQWIESGIKPKE